MAFSVTGIGSGIDWTSILNTYRQAETQRIQVFSDQQTAASNKLSAWNTFAGKISSLQSAAADLKSASSFDLFSTSLSSSSSTVAASSLLSATASSSASTGTYQVVVNSKAQVQKLASYSFASSTSTVGVAGTILVNGKSVTVAATDTIKDLANKINAVNSGTTPSNVTASILQESSNSVRLVLTSGVEGALGMSLQNASSNDVLAGLGFNDGSGLVVRNRVTGGALSDSFTSTSTAVETLLGISDQAISENITIDGKTVNIDLSSTLTQIKDALNTAGITASIVTDNSGSTPTYRLQVEGMNSWTENGSGTSNSRVLQALGIIQGTRADISGLRGSLANTTDGSTPISSTTLIKDIYGYLNPVSGSDKITISGKKHDGTAVSADFTIDGTKTVGDLLSAIQTQFGNVTASVTPDGKIQVVDNASGTSQFSVNLQSTLTGTNPGTLSFGTFGTVGTVAKRVMQQGEDASFTVDGVSMTSSTNAVTTAISGVTLNLLGEDSGTTVTVNVGRDATTIEGKVKSMLDAYNAVIGFINGQMTYDSSTKATGGPLFGDNTLKSIKLVLQNTILKQVGSGSVNSLAAAGVSIGTDNNLSLDTSKFENLLSTNFNDLVNLFTDTGTCTDSRFQYSFSGRNTISGTYSVSISTLSPLTGQIAGESASISGTVLSLSSTTSNANGLGINFSGTTLPANANFSFSRGIASLIEGITYNMGDTNGLLTTQQGAVQKSIDSLTQKISDQNDLVDQKIAQLQQQFQAADAAITKLQSMQSYLSQQFK